MCGYPFEVGHEYLVFANERQGNLFVSICSATQPAKAASSRIRQLRAMRDGTALPDLFGFVGTDLEEQGVGVGERVQPVPGLIVKARSDTQENRTQTAEDGTYEFRVLPRGSFRMSVEAPPGRRALWHGAEIMSTGAGIGCPADFEIRQE